MTEVQILSAWIFDRPYPEGCIAVLNAEQMDALKQSGVPFQVIEDAPMFTPREAAPSVAKTKSATVEKSFDNDSEKE